MSWPHTWQGGMPAVVAAVPTINAAPTVLNPAAAMPGMQYTTEQWTQMQQQNWQQWAQWQQQYQQWHQQYGAEYQKSMSAMQPPAMAGMPSMAGPPAMAAPPSMAGPPMGGLPMAGAPPMPTSAGPPLPQEPKPPLPPDEPPAAPPPNNYQSYTTAPPKPNNYNTAPPQWGNQQPNMANPPPNLMSMNMQKTPDNYPKPDNYGADPNYSRDKYGQKPDIYGGNNYTTKPPDNYGGVSEIYGGKQENYGTKRPYNIQNDFNKDPKRNKFEQNWQSEGQPPLPPVNPNNPEELSETEKKFMKQFTEWEAQFNKWKEQNQGHPDKTQYKEYEKKWEAWRNQLLERREQMRRKRLGTQCDTPESKSPTLIKSQGANQSFTVPPNLDKPPPNINNEPLQFKQKQPDVTFMEPDDDNSFLKSNTTDGIPGLDLVKGDGATEEDAEKVETEVAAIEAVPNKEVTDAEKSTDLDAISKNINSILGDQKLLSMLSMVTQNQNLNAVSTTVDSTSAITEVDPATQADVNTNIEPPITDNRDMAWNNEMNKGGNTWQEGGYNQGNMYGGKPGNDFTRPPPLPNFQMQPKFLPPGPGGNFQNQFRSPGNITGPNNFPDQPGNNFMPGRDIGRNIGFGEGSNFPGNRNSGNFDRGTGFQNIGNYENDNFQKGPGTFDRNSDLRKPGPGNFDRGPDFPKLGGSFERPGDNFKGPVSFEKPPDFPRGLGNFERPPDFQKGAPGYFDRNADLPKGGPGMLERSTDFLKGGPPNVPRTLDFQKPTPLLSNFDRGVGFQARGGGNFDRDVGFEQGGFGRNTDFQKGGSFQKMGAGNFDRATPFQKAGNSSFDRDPDFQNNGPNFGSNFNRGGFNNDNFQKGNFKGSGFDRGFEGSRNLSNYQEGDNRRLLGNFRGDNLNRQSDNFNNRSSGGFDNFEGEDYNENDERNDYDDGEHFDESRWQDPECYPSEDPFAEEELPMEAMEVEQPPVEEEPVLDDLLCIEKVIDYDHKPLKTESLDVAVEPPLLFDYRHKAVNRIPLPQRPKWLLDSFRSNYPEFEPLIVRPPAQALGRYTPNERSDFRSGAQNYGRFDDHGGGYERRGGYDDRRHENVRDNERRPDNMRDNERRPENMRDNEWRPENTRDNERRPENMRDNEWRPENARDNERRPENMRDNERRPENMRDNERRPENMRDNDRRPENMRDNDRRPENMRDNERRPENMRDNERRPDNMRDNERRPDSRYRDEEQDSRRGGDRNEEPELRRGGDRHESRKFDNFDRNDRNRSPIRNFRENEKTEIFSQNVDKPAAPVTSKTIQVTLIDDLLNAPGRFNRPSRIVIILRGPPGSGKTFLAKLIKDKEVENGGSAPRILSLDDYFMVEQEKESVEDGKSVKIKEMVYEYEECMEDSYRNSLLKSFKKTITDGYFPFIIVDNVNEKIKYFAEMWSFAKQNGFQVYICQLELDVQTCTKRNTHGRSEIEIDRLVAGWEATPSHHPTLDATSLVQSGSINEVEMEEIDSPNETFDEFDAARTAGAKEGQACNSSKWDNLECSIDNLAKLDGISKPLRAAGTMEDYLQLDDDCAASTRSSKPGQKRVRWADLEERKEQEKMRAIGFVVGQTDWSRMMDPTKGERALTKTKYIERVKRYNY